jgi:hypothetical protein
MGKAWASLLIVLAVCLSGGCQGMHVPRIQGPGTAPYQRALAERYDPYPDNETGPPVVGGRPLEFQHPPAETQRSRFFFDSPRQRSAPYLQF